MKYLLLLSFLSLPFVSIGQEAIDTLVEKACLCYETGDVEGFDIEEPFPTCVYKKVSRNANYRAIIDAVSAINSRHELEKMTVKRLVAECDVAYHFYKKALPEALDILVKEEELSLDEINEDIANDPEDGEHFVNRGVFYLFIKKEPARALEDFNQAMELEDDPTSYAFRGLCYQAMGDLDNAIADFEKVAISEDEPIFFLFWYMAQREKAESK